LKKAQHNGKFKTKKRFGQHLLISEGIIKKIVDEIHIEPEDIIVEIGVGTGQLTKEILHRNPKKLYGVEIDKTAYPIIEEKFSKFKNFELIKKDYFDVNLYEIAGNSKIKLVGNLPYNVSSLILVDTAFKTDILKLCVFMIQKEVAEKLIAKPKTKNFTFLTVFIQTFFDVEYVMSVPARFFSPPPKVVSAVVKLIPKEKIPVKDIKDFKSFISNIFAQRRKMLRTKIKEEILEKAKLKPTARIEELDKDDILRLYLVSREFLSET
jgi:16S rRNA (adenine1518-N6/adenine1519-N6)-dimethyltransferase